MNDNIFMQASQLQLRFEHKGSIGLEDLWDLSLESLNDIYRKLKASKKSDEDSLMSVSTSEDKLLNLKMEIVETVFKEKKQALDKKKLAKENKEKKDQLKMILAQKQNESLLASSIEDLQKMIDELE